MENMTVVERIQNQVEALDPTPGNVLEVLQWPDPRLRQVSRPVISGIIEDQGLQDLLNDMVATMQAYRAVGLAAIQVGVSLRVLVVQDRKLEPVKMINPVIKDVDGRSFEKEGCLSFGGLFVAVERPTEATVEYFDENGDKKVVVVQGLMAKAVVHEMEHLEGKVFLDSVSKMRRQSSLKELESIRSRKTKRGPKDMPAKKKR